MSRDMPLIVASILRREGGTGVHTHVRQLCRYLDTQQRETAVVTPFSWSRALAVPVFSPRLILERWSGSMSVAWYRYWHEALLTIGLRQRLIEVGDAIVYAQGPEAARAALRARVGPHQQVIMAVHFEASQANGWVEKLYIRRDSAMFEAIRGFERQVIPQLDGIVYVSRSARDHLLSWLPEASAVRSAVIPNFVAPIEAPVPQQPTCDLVSIGSLVPAKNHRFLLEVLAETKRRGSPLTLDIFGDGPCRAKLTRRIGSLGLTNEVRLLGFRPNAQALLSNYRAYVHPSYTETSSLAIIESMAAGLPIVASKAGGLSELFDEGIEGRFLPLDDPTAAAQVLIDLLGSDNELRRLGANAVKRFHRHFDMRIVAPRLLSFLMGHPCQAQDMAQNPEERRGALQPNAT